jgi:hypothetical protein
MNRLACIFVCLVLSLGIFGCSSSTSGLENSGKNISDVPSSTQIFAAWNNNAAANNFSSAQHLTQLGSLYNGGNFGSDIWNLGTAVNAALNFDTGLQNGTGIMVFCEFTGDGCRPK